MGVLARTEVPSEGELTLTASECGYKKKLSKYK